MVNIPLRQKLNALQKIMKVHFRPKFSGDEMVQNVRKWLIRDGGFSKSYFVETIRNFLWHSHLLIKKSVSAVLNHLLMKKKTYNRNQKI